MFIFELCVSPFPCKPSRFFIFCFFFLFLFLFHSGLFLTHILFADWALKTSQRKLLSILSSTHVALFQIYPVRCSFLLLVTAFFFIPLNLLLETLVTEATNHT